MEKNPIPRLRRFVVWMSAQEVRGWAGHSCRADHPAALKIFFSGGAVPRSAAEDPAGTLTGRGPGWPLCGPVGRGSMANPRYTGRQVWNRGSPFQAGSWSTPGQHRAWPQGRVPAVNLGPRGLGFSYPRLVPRKPPPRRWSARPDFLHRAAQGTRSAPRGPAPGRGRREPVYCWRAGLRAGRCWAAAESPGSPRQARLLLCRHG